jgi:ferredoxin/DMSO/TMAO reductase YedYZ heme-binding membrane subunit
MRVMRTAAESVHLIAATVGFISFFLLWLAVVWGMVLRNGWASTRIRHHRVEAIHRIVALLGLTLAAVHTFAQMAVPFGPIRLIDTFVPFINPRDPVGVGVAVIGLEIMVATTLSVLIQRMLGHSRWRALHAMTYAAFMLVVAHVLISGSDVGTVWAWGPVLGAWAITVLLWITTTPWLRRKKRQVAERIFSSQRGVDVSVNVDPQRCARFGFCEHEAPEVFQLRSDGRLSYVATVAAEQVAAVVRAVEVCPARAIMLNQAPTAVLTPKPTVLPDDGPPPGPRGPGGPRPGPRPGPGRPGSGLRPVNPQGPATGQQPRIGSTGQQPRIGSTGQQPRIGSGHRVNGRTRGEESW